MINLKIVDDFEVYFQRTWQLRRVWQLELYSNPFQAPGRSGVRLGRGLLDESGLLRILFQEQMLLQF